MIQFWPKLPTTQSSMAQPIWGWIPFAYNPNETLKLMGRDLSELDEQVNKDIENHKAKTLTTDDFWNRLPKFAQDNNLTEDIAIVEALKLYKQAGWSIEWIDIDQELQALWWIQQTTQAPNIQSFDTQEEQWKRNIWARIFEKVEDIWSWLKFGWETGSLAKSSNPFVSSFWSFVDALKFVWNIPWDTIELVWQVWQMVSEPIQTAKSIEALAWWIIEKWLLSVLPKQIWGKTFDWDYTTEERRLAVEWLSQALKDNFWTIEKAKTTIIENPTDVLLTIQWWLNLAKKWIKDPNKIAQIDKINEAISPINIMRTEVWAIREWARKWSALTDAALWKTTWTSADTIRAVREFSWTPEFSAWLSWKRSLQDIAKDLTSSVSEINANKNIVYWKWYEAIKNSTTKIDLQPITAALSKNLKDNLKVKIGKDWKLDFSDSVITWRTDQLNIQAMFDDIKRWTNNTPDWLDTLKQRISNYYRGVDDSRQADRLATILSKDIKWEIVSKIPEYAKITAAYEKTIKDLKAIQKSLSLWKEKDIQTAVNKLASTFKENYGSRQEVIKMIEQYTWQNFQAQIAWATMNPILARWLTWYLLGWGIIYTAGQLFSNPSMIAWLAIASPRAIWEIARVVWVSKKKLTEFTNNIKKLTNEAKSRFPDAPQQIRDLPDTSKIWTPWVWILETQED